jgi:type 1 fimbria pilin
MILKGIEIMIKKVTGGLCACLFTSAAFAHDGVVNFEGEAVQSTCVFEGFSRDGATPSVNPVIALPDVTLAELEGGNIAGEISLWLHFRDCVYMAGHRDVSATFNTALSPWHLIICPGPTASCWGRLQFSP